MKRRRHQERMQGERRQKNQEPQEEDVTLPESYMRPPTKTRPRRIRTPRISSKKDPDRPRRSSASEKKPTRSPSYTAQSLPESRTYYYSGPATPSPSSSACSEQVLPHSWIREMDLPLVDEPRTGTSCPWDDSDAPESIPSERFEDPHGFDVSTENLNAVYASELDLVRAVRRSSLSAQSHAAEYALPSEKAECEDLLQYSHHEWREEADFSDAEDSSSCPMMDTYLSMVRKSWN